MFVVGSVPLCLCQLLKINLTNLMKYKPTYVKDVVAWLKTFDQNAIFVVGSDEELNNLYWGFYISKLVDEKNPKVVIYGLSGQVLDD
jgi:hypothetical protein